MQAPFTDFAKALLVYRGVYLQKKALGGWMGSLRGLEAALLELTGTRDVTRVSAAVCNKACEYMDRYWTKGRPSST